MSLFCGLVLFLASVAVVHGISTGGSCVPLQNDTVFCTTLIGTNHNISSTVDVALQDGMARLTYDLMLSQLSGRGIVLRPACARAMRAYACGSAFPLCQGDTAPEVLPLCEATCSMACDLCHSDASCFCLLQPTTNCFNLPVDTSPVTDENGAAAVSVHAAAFSAGLAAMLWLAHAS